MSPLTQGLNYRSACDRYISGAQSPARGHIRPAAGCHVPCDVQEKQESCVIAKMTAHCALYLGALKIFGTP